MKHCTESVKLIRNLRTSEKNGKPRIFLEPPVLEIGEFAPGDCISYTFVNDALIISKAKESNKIVSKRKRPSWKEHRPLIDYCNDDLKTVIRAREKIDILVSKGMIVIRHERSFDLCVIKQPRLEGSTLIKLRLTSIPSGGGMAIAALIDTGFYSSVGACDIWGAAIESYYHNFREGTIFW